MSTYTNKRGPRTADNNNAPTHRKQVLLDDRTIDTMKHVGKGSLSAGIRIAARKISILNESTPLIVKAKT